MPKDFESFLHDWSWRPSHHHHHLLHLLQLQSLKPNESGASDGLQPRRTLTEQEEPSSPPGLLGSKVNALQEKHRRLDPEALASGPEHHIWRTISGLQLTSHMSLLASPHWLLRPSSSSELQLLVFHQHDSNEQGSTSNLLAGLQSPVQKSVPAALTVHQSDVDGCSFRGADVCDVRREEEEEEEKERQTSITSRQESHLFMEKNL